MSEAVWIQRNFTSGEVSEKLQGHSDLSRYFNACSTMENFLPHPLGGAFYRSGTFFIARTRNDQPCKLIRFTYSDQYVYVLEFTDHYLRFYRNRIPIYSTGTTPYEIYTPYLSAELSDITCCQSIDVMFLAEGHHYPQQLIRSAHNSWSMQEIEIKDGPYLPINDDLSAFVTPTANYGNITLTCTNPIWSSNQIGSLFRIKQSGISQRQTLNAIGQIASELLLYGKFQVDISPHQAYTTSPVWSGQIVLQRSYDGSNWMTVATFLSSTRQEFIETEPWIHYRLMCKDYTSGEAVCALYQDECWGAVEITSFASAYQVGATVVVQLASTEATSDWREGAWSDKNGYPRTVCFDQDRLTFTGTTTQPQTVWKSWSQDYTNFMPELTEDDAALEFTPNAREASPYVWVLSRRGGMILGSTTGIDTLSSQDGKAVTAKNPPIYDNQPSGGTAQGIQPVQIGSTILYVHRHRRQVMELAYDLQKDEIGGQNLNQLGIAGTDLNLANTGIGISGIIDMTFQEHPIPRIWCPVENGSMGVLTYLPGEKIIAWTPITTTGSFERSCSAPTSVGTGVGTDDVYVCVMRWVREDENRSMRRYIEVFGSNDDITDIADYHYLDCAVFQENEIFPQTEWTTINHLPGIEMRVFADGLILNSQTVEVTGSTPNPVFVTEMAVQKLLVGVGYTGTLIPMKIDLQIGSGGTIQGMYKRILKLWLRVYKSIGGMTGPDTSNMKYIPDLVSDVLVMNEQVEPFTGIIPVSFAGNPMLDGEIIIQQTEPLPLNILSIIAKISVGDG